MTELAGQNGTVARPLLRAVQSDLLGAQDVQILKVVAMVDKLPARGAADQFIAPIRPRLAALRPQRAMNFTRLLYLPLQPMIVQPTAWRRDALAVPRSALLPLSRQVRSGLGDEAAELDRRISALTSVHEAEIRTIGAELWPRASAILAAAPPPEDWSAATGLQPADHRAILDLVVAALGGGAAIETIVAQALRGKPPAAVDLEVLLTQALGVGATSFSAIAMLLATRLPNAQPVLMMADDIAARKGEPAMRLAVDQIIDAAIDRVEANISESVQLSQAASALRGVVALLQDLELQCASRPSRKARIVQLRRSIDMASREQFNEAMTGKLLVPAEALAQANDAEVAQLETAARDLRRFEGIASRLGGAEHYSSKLKAAAGALKPRDGETMQVTVDRVRLIEILQGSEAAAAAMPS